MSGIFGGGGEQAFRTRRGIEKTLFRFTIVLIVVFIVLCILSVRLA
jgi:protein translocase SecG subunit